MYNNLEGKTAKMSIKQEISCCRVNFLPALVLYDHHLKGIILQAIF